MGSVEDLGHRLWTQKANGKGSDSSAAFQIRLDLTSDAHLTRLAQDFGMPKATLGQELLRAAINDVIRSNPYATAADMMSDEDLDRQGLSGSEILQDSTGRPMYKDEV